MAQRLGVAPEEGAEYVRRVFGHMARDTYRPALFEGIDTALRALADQGPIAILSASPLVVIESALERAGVSDTVQAIRDGRDPASKAAKLPELLDRLGASPGQAVMIGDGVSDVRAGQFNGMRTAAVTWGWQSHARLEAAGPDWLLTRVGDLLTLPARLDGHAGASCTSITLPSGS